MRLSMPCLVAAVVVSTAEAQMVGTQRLPTTEVGRAAKAVNEWAYLALSGEYVVEGVQVVEDPVVVAELVVFHPGSRLVLGAGKSGDQGERHLAARTIKVIPGGTPPVITWRHEARPPASPSIGVKAAAGVPGSLPGAGGGRGANGNTGNPGITGRSAPTLYLFASRVEGGRLEIDLRGQDGGPGGAGQEAGDGGPGSPGRKAEASIVGCSAPGGNGGPGGDGGRGGKGGPGGRGGTGGTLVLVSTSRGAAEVQRLLTIRNDGGKGGPPGDGGRKGRPGSGGEPGRPEGTCQPGQPGPPGAEGEDGEGGEPGPDGVRGASAVSTMTDEQFSRVIGRR